MNRSGKDMDTMVKQKEPLVSIVIITYNSVEFVQET